MIPDRADVVVIGGGIIGCSIAYHLTRIGISDVVLLERRQLCCGTTWHSVGSVAELRGNRPMTELARYSSTLYRSLEAETGQATGYRRTGSIMLALDRERLMELKRTVALARAFGQEADLVSVAEIEELCPSVRTDDVLAGLYLPSDGRTNPIDTTQALAKGARTGGAKIIENMLVDELEVADGRVVGVRTAEGTIRADVVVLAAGMWSRAFGLRHGVSLPLQAAEHFYAVTEPIEPLDWTVPFIRVPDESTYYKEDGGKVLFGCLERTAKPWALDGIPPDFCFDSLPEDLEHFEPILLGAIERFPLLQSAGIKLFFNGPESFTSDGNALVGETPELRNLFVACGMNTVGVMAGGGIGRLLAQWIHDRERPAGYEGFDVARISTFQAGRSFMRDRTVETLGVLYGLAIPNREYRSARGARRSPIHDALLRAGAIMGERAGFEVPLVFAPPGEEREIRLSYGRQSWVPWAAAECRAAIADAALFDGSAAAKIELSGSDAATLLDRLSASETVMADGSGPALWLTRDGTIAASVRVLRLAEDRFLILSPAGTERRIVQWLQRYGNDQRIACRDVTSAFGNFLFAGPASGACLAAAGASLDAEHAPTHSEIGYAPAIVMPFGDLEIEGWLVVVPAEFTAHAIEHLAEARGGPVALAGRYAFEALRIESGQPSWPGDMDDTVTPLALGLAERIAWRKSDFVGRDALLAARDAGAPEHRLVKTTLLEDRLALYGQEAILRDGKPVGLTSCGAWSHRAGAPIALGFVDVAGVSLALGTGDFAVDVSGEVIPARTVLCGSNRATGV